MFSLQGPRRTAHHSSDYMPSSQALLQIMIIITGNYNFFNLLTLVLTTALLDDHHLSAEPGLRCHKKMPTCECLDNQTDVICQRTPVPWLQTLSQSVTVLSIAWPKALLTMLSLLLELSVYGLLAYGTVYYFGLEVDWQQYIILSKTSECQLGDLKERAGSVPNHTPSLGSFHFPSVLPVAEDGNPAYCVAGDSLSGLGIACCPLEVCMYLKSDRGQKLHSDQV